MITIQTSPIAGQKSGTSGLRRKTRDWMAPRFLENYTQCVINAIQGADDKRFIIGGDGRFYNTEAIQFILRILAGNGAAEVFVGQNGLLSTPAASHLIRLHGADGGFILSASHNPGGIDADFGLKYNMQTGSAAPEQVTAEFYAQTQQITAYRTVDHADIDLSEVGTSAIADMTVHIIDPIADYADLMSKQFNFNVLRDILQSNFTMCFDAMHAVTGPYAQHLFVDTLGAPQGSVRNATPSVDFAKGHPDPNPVVATDLMTTMFGPDAPDFGAASDGDGDRNMVVGRGIYVSPSDSLAVLAAHANLIPAFAHGLKGVVRSMPTSGAVDRVAAARHIPAYETPTGWKYFGALLDAGLVNLCGEESAGTGADHLREKDGIWAVLFWLSIIAETGKSVTDIMTDHWATYGRNYYTRHDYENVPSADATAMITALEDRCASLVGQTFAGLRVTQADAFTYTDPIDGRASQGHGHRILFEGGARAVFHLSGTGTQGATVRAYFERYAPADTALDLDPQAALTDVIAAALEITQLSTYLGRSTPDVIS